MFILLVSPYGQNSRFPVEKAEKQQRDKRSIRFVGSVSENPNTLLVSPVKPRMWQLLDACPRKGCLASYGRVCKRYPAENPESYL